MATPSFMPQDVVWHIVPPAICFLATVNLNIGKQKVVDRQGERRDWHRRGRGAPISPYSVSGDAYKVAMLRGKSLDAIRSFYLRHAWRERRTLRFADRIGSLLARAMRRNVTVINLRPSEFIEWRLNFSIPSSTNSSCS